MNRLAGLRGKLGLARPRGADFYDRAERVRRVPVAELDVAEAALAQGGAIADRLLRQLHEAEGVWRLIAVDGEYELRISTTDNLRVRDVPRSGWTSEWIRVSTADDARPLELRADVPFGGIVGLYGRSLDGRPWPAKWSAPEKDLEVIRARAPWLQLPTPEEMRAARASAVAAIEAWLGRDGALRGRRGVVRADPPASNGEVAAFAAKEAFALPEAYESLVRRADGVEVGRSIVMGTRYAYRLDMPGPPRLVIAPPNEDGALTIAESGEVVWVELGDETTDGRVVASDLRQWLTTKLTRRTKAATAT